MGKETLTFVDTEIEKKNFYRNESLKGCRY